MLELDSLLQMHHQASVVNQALANQDSLNSKCSTVMANPCKVTVSQCLDSQCQDSLNNMECHQSWHLDSQDNQDSHHMATASLCQVTGSQCKVMDSQCKATASHQQVMASQCQVSQVNQVCRTHMDNHQTTESNESNVINDQQLS